MIEKLKQYWHVQYKIAAAKLFREFIGFLAKGGNQAVDFYNHNEQLVQALLANPHNSESLDDTDLKKLIAESLKQPVENQQWFFERAKEKLNEVKRVLTEKYKGTLRYGQELGIDLSGSTPESLWLDLCRYEQEQPAAESATEPEQEQPSPEQRFKVQLSEMSGVGMSDAEIWEVVKDEAKALKLTKAKVLAELAEIRK